MIFSLTRSPPSVEQDRIHHPSVSSTYRATYSGENMAPSRSTPRMMQMTRAAFQAVVSLNEQATDPKSHTLVRITYTLSSPVLSPANSDGRPHKGATHERYSRRRSSLDQYSFGWYFSTAELLYPIHLLTTIRANAEINCYIPTRGN